MVTEPSSIEGLVYFTNRAVGNGRVKAWVYKADCPKCSKARMAKPIEKGKVLLRSKEYQCPNCSYKESKEEHEAKLIVEVIYTCPYCQNQGEATTEYKKKSFEGVPAYVFSCQKCGKKIGITKKMKEASREEGVE